MSAGARITPTIQLTVRLLVIVVSSFLSDLLTQYTETPSN